MDELRVNIDFGDGQRTVGKIIREKKKLFFAYDPEFLISGHNLSPFKLRWEADLQQANNQVFEGLFGVFADSLPDGWGRLLLDRELVRSGINLGEVGPLHRLAYVGKTGKGALTYEPTKWMAPNEAEPTIILDELAGRAAKVLNDQLTDDAADLLHLGGSSGGARPKIQVLYKPTEGHLTPNALPVPPGYEAWIIKIPAGIDSVDAGMMEYAYSLTASDAGIPMTDCRLFESTSGRKYFGTKRFDRGVANQRYHLHSFAGLVHDNFRLPNSDYGHLMNAAFRLEQDTAALQKVLRMAAFNVFTHNRDDHGNNFSFLMDETGAWSLTPAYDLTFSNSSHGEHSLTVAGEGKRPGWDELRKLAAHFDVPQTEDILAQSWEAAKILPERMRTLGCGEAAVGAIKTHISQVR